MTPNPLVLDPQDPAFTELSGHPNRWMTAGLIGDASAIMGRGFEQFLCEQSLDMDAKIEEGDTVLLGNRIGTVLSFTKVGNVIKTITVREDFSSLPIKVTPLLSGYNADGISRTVTYVLGTNTTAAGIRNGSGVILFTGYLLVLRKTKEDPAQNGLLAQAMDRFNNRGLPKIYSAMCAAADHCAVPAETPDGDILIFTVREDVTDLVTGDTVYTSVNRYNKLGDGIYYAGNDFYFAVSEGLVIDLPAC